MLRSRDTVIVARLDRLSRSFIGFAQILDSWTKLKVGIHLCDMPGGHFDPDNPMSEMMIGILIVFANYERRLISQRTREGLQARKQRGEKYCRWPEYGWRWEKRFDPRLKKDVNVKVPDERESVRYSSPTSTRNLSRSRISLSTRVAISFCWAVRAPGSSANHSAARLTDSSEISPIWRPPTFTHSASGLSR